MASSLQPIVMEKGSHVECVTRLRPRLYYMMNRVNEQEEQQSNEHRDFYNVRPLVLLRLRRSLPVNHPQDRLPSVKQAKTFFFSQFRLAIILRAHKCTDGPGTPSIDLRRCRGIGFGKMYGTLATPSRTRFPAGTSPFTI